MFRFFISVGSVALLVLLVASCGQKPESGDQAARRGFQLLLKEEYGQAAQALEASIEKGLVDEPYEYVYTCLGNAYGELGKFEKSIVFHKKAIEANSDFHKAWVNLGIVYRLTGEYAEAERCYLKALELEPEYAELHASIGALYIYQEKYPEAVQHLEKATELDRQLPVAWANLSLAYATVGRFELAEAALKKAVVLGYKNGPVLRERIDNLKASTENPAENANKPDAGHS